MFLQRRFIVFTMKCQLHNSKMHLLLNDNQEDNKNEISHQTNTGKVSRPQSNFHSDINWTTCCICQSLGSAKRLVRRMLDENESGISFPFIYFFLFPIWIFLLSAFPIRSARWHICIEKPRQHLLTYISANEIIFASRAVLPRSCLYNLTSNLLFCAWVQTGYYDRPTFTNRKHFNPSDSAVYFDYDLFRPPQHFPQQYCMQMHDLF